MHLDSTGVLVACPSCRTKNRLRYSALERATQCGKCRASLPLTDAPIDVGSTEEFDASVSQSSVPVVVDFWAAWCGPCKMVAPEIAKVAAHLAGKALVLKVDTDVQQELAERYGIQGIPTIAVFHHGREVTRASGARPASAIEAMVPQLV